MKVLVTGGTGFLGSHVVRQLLAAGHRARLLYRSAAKLEALAGLKFEAVLGDLHDSAALNRACAGCDAVMHIAAKADYWKDDDRAALWRINVEGARNLFAAAAAAGVGRVIFTSSASAIGIRPGKAPADESDAFSLPPERFWYAWTKVKAEAIAAEFAADGMDIITLNPTVITGPGDMNAISGSFILAAARYQWLMPMSRGGLAVIDVRDAAAAHISALTRGRSGERYILNAANLPYAQWYRLIADACGIRPPLLTSPDWLLEPTARLIELLRALGLKTPLDANQTRLGGQHLYFDGGKAARELHSPRIDIATSLRQTYDWYQENGYIKRDALTRLLSLL